MEQLFERIVIPVDFSPASESAARFGCSLAKKLGADAYLIHVVEPSDNWLADVTGQRHQYRLWALDALGELANRVRLGGTVSTEVRRGRVPDEIRHAVTAYGADLVVMATHDTRSHLMFGSVAEEIMRTVRCPVLVMRDSGQVQIHRPESAAAREPDAIPA
jgi:nucleotide-binding universal stress UspA family protein